MSKSFDTSSLLHGTSFEPNAILRGAQLTIVGAHRALQNPAIFTSEHYKQAALAVLSGILIRLLVAIPTLGIRVLVRFICLFGDCNDSSWDEDVVEGITYIEHHVLQVPFFLMSFIRYLSPAMDHMFMDSLAWVDQTYVAKHKSEDPSGLRAMYYPNLRMYDGVHTHREKIEGKPQNPYVALKAFLMRMGKKAGLSLGVYLASFLPVVGRFVLPAASFYTFNKAVGTPAAVLIFGSGLVVPKQYLVMFLQSYFASRSLMRELLEPYFSRVHYSSSMKKQWFHDRSGVLYGFSFAFFVFLKIPLVGVLIYGIAEASTAYLITKITEPPPPPTDVATFMEKDVRWKNKHEFLSLPLDALDRFNASTDKARETLEKRKKKAGEDLKGRQFT